MRTIRLKTIRVAVSLVIFVLLALPWLEYADFFLKYVGWVSRFEIFPTIVSGFAVGMLVLWMLVSFIFGRIYCSSVCPIGTLLDIVGHIGKNSRKGSLRDYHYSRPLIRWRQVSLVVIVLCAVLELSIVPLLVNPASMYSRFLMNIVRPALMWLDNGIGSIGEATGLWTVHTVPVVTATLLVTFMSLIPIIAISIPAWKYGRTYCNSICPIGTLLGYMSAQSVWHIDIDTDRCTNCRKCEHACKASCIDLIDHVVDGSRCVNCFNCLDACEDNAIFYTPSRKQLSLPMFQKISNPKVRTSTTMTSGSAASPIQSDNNITENETIS